MCEEDRALKGCGEFIQWSYRDSHTEGRLVNPNEADGVGGFPRTREFSRDGALIN